MLGDGKIMKENELTPVTKIILVIFLFLAVVSALANILRHHVPHPGAFIIVFVGFLCFVAAKLSIILHKKRVSFGSRLMSENLGNLYRLGYWLMAVGILMTFL